MLRSRYDVGIGVVGVTSSALYVASGCHPRSANSPPVAGLPVTQSFCCVHTPPSLHDLKMYSAFRLCVLRNNSVSSSQGLSWRMRVSPAFVPAVAVSMSLYCFARNASVHTCEKQASSQLNSMFVPSAATPRVTPVTWHGGAGFGVR